MLSRKAFIFVFVVVIGACASAHAFNGAVKDKVTFTPHELPCAYKIRIAYTSSVSGSVSNITNYVRGYFYRKDQQKLKDMSTGSLFVRFDINYEDPSGNLIVALFSNLQDKDECLAMMQPETEVQNQINKELELFLNPSEYDHEGPGVFNGVACKKYYDDNDDSNYSLYVDKENYVLGYTYDEEGEKFEVECTYGFDVPLKTFAASKSEMKGCNKTLYEKPDKSYDICLGSSSSSSSGSYSSSTIYSSSASGSSVSSSTGPSSSSSSVMIKSNAILSLTILMFMLLLLL